MKDNVKLNRKKQNLICIFFLLIAILSLIVELVYHFFLLHNNIHWVYIWLEFFTIVVFITCLITSGVIWIPDKLLRIILMLLIFICGISSTIYYGYKKKDTIIFKQSPNSSETLILYKNPNNNSVQIEKRIYFLFLKYQDQLPYTVNSELKYQWLTNDICAITYKSTDDNTHQYIATFGDRGNGISYLDPKTAISGNWSSKTDNSKLTLIVDRSTITVTDDNNQWIYNDNDCVRFGTIAIALCKNGIPQWSIALNEDSKINYDCMIAKGGTLTLCPVSMDKTDPITLDSTDSKNEYSETNPNLQNWSENETEAEKNAISLMQKYQKGNNITEDSLENNGIIILKNTDDNIPWILLQSLKTKAESYRINGIDSRVQIDSIQQLAGDTDDGLYDVFTTSISIAPGNQGASPSGEITPIENKIRLLKCDTEYLALILNYNSDGTYGLNKKSGKKETYSDQLKYHYFLSGKYDTTYMYVSRKSPEEGVHIAYKNYLQQQYPNAEAKDFDEMPYMKLDNNTLLLYDGISSDYGNYCYWKVKLSEQDLFSNKAPEHEDMYEIPIENQ